MNEQELQQHRADAINTGVNPWWRRLLRSPVKQSVEKPTNGRGTIPEAWLFDAPLFIDGPQITSFYNAVALPAFERESLTISTKDVKVSKWTAKGQVEISAGDSFLASILAPISAKATLAGERGGERTRGSERTWKLTPVDAPERRLTNLAIHYAANLKDQVWTVDGVRDPTWLKELGYEHPVLTEGSSSTQHETTTPRPLIFLDVGLGTPVMPMAAELDNGRVVKFFNKIGSKVTLEDPKAPPPPDYPKSDVGDGAVKFWSWLTDTEIAGADSSHILMNVVEEEIETGGRPNWFDLRVPLGSPGSQNQSLHLHIQSRGNYFTGDFAYQLVLRGRSNGFRLVGTLKDGPALNVLALYQK